MQFRRTQSRSAPRQRNAPPSAPVLFDELMVEILSWLPVKSLARFSCVCKSWKSLISDPQFVKLHLHRSATNADFAHLRLVFEPIPNDQRYAISCSLDSLLDNPSFTIGKEHVSYRLKYKKYRVIGSCNGLICLVGYVLEKCWVRLWNPATRLRSQKSPCFYVDSRIYRICLTSFGFGYDHISDTFKVVAVLYYRSDKEDSEKTEVKVCSMGDNCWRNIRSFPAVPSLRQDDGVYLSGTLNWVAVRNFSSGYKWDAVLTNDQFVIVSLDLGKETCRQLLLPHIPDEVPHVEPALRVVRDCLCVYHDYKRTHFVVWQMKEFGVEESWTQFLNVSYQDLQIGRRELPSLLPLCMSENGDVIMVSSFARPHGILYNRRDNRLKRCQIPDYIYWIDAKLYIESLVSPRSRFT